MKLHLAKKNKSRVKCQDTVTLDSCCTLPLQNKDCDMTTLFDHTQDSGPSETPWGVGSEALHHSNHSNHDNVKADQEVHLMETPLQHGNLKNDVL